MNEEFAKVSMIDHLDELRRRLIRCALFFVVAIFIFYFFAADIYQVLVEPLAKASGGADRKMIYTSLTEAFFTYLKLAIFAAFFVTFPFLASQLYLFLAPGLYKHEKNALLPFLIAAPVLFLSGAALVYFAVMPLAWEFFLSFETANAALPIKLEAKIDQYLSLVMSLIIGFGVAFQFPVIIMLLAKVGVVNAAQLKKNRKYAIVLIAIISALLTPPDVISQLLMLTSLCALYELSIFGCKFYSKPSK